MKNLKPEEYPMATFWNSRMDMNQTLRDFELHNKCYLNNIQDYMKNLQNVIFLFDVLLANSSKFSLIMLLRADCK